ncbi:NB-ARC domain-containing protein [Dolichospermum lemmermannii CS-548]|uniref:NB-ARC domain-containing protein n=1 Tax=Dolichospermum lemmermannii TaxID=54295 RepID=UPI002330D766|nr:NB-ARC domain-containing protein [Dolichospermum lemmermannii]MDB9436864.1 NB-ARC domain-containing protein [Dolichospermum lemmermannii CS-548]
MPRSLRIHHNYINETKSKIIQKGYRTQRALADDAGLCLTTVSNFLNGKPVDYATFEELCRRLSLDWQKISISNTEVISTPLYSYAKIRKEQTKISNQDWGTAIDISAFYGRSQELTQLESWILEDGCHLVGLFGMDGVGKTTLATQLTKQIQDQFDYVFWRSVPTVPSFDSMITEMLSFISHRRESTPDINQLIHYLYEHRCLIIWDNLDTVLDVDYIKYIQLIRIIADTKHQSNLIFTSRDKPVQLTELEGWSLSVRSLRLTGSSEIALSLLQSRRLLGTDQHKYELSHSYGHNPLKIKIVVNIIIDLFDGNIEKFLKQNTLLVSNYINSLLEQQLNPLSVLEWQIMYCLATDQRLINLTDLAQNQNILPNVSISQLLQAIERLYSRSLIEREAGMYSLQSVLREYVMEKFINKL